MKPFLIAICLTTSPALADCPVAGDLELGVVITESDGTRHTYHDVGGVVVQLQSILTDSDVHYRNLLAHGTHVIRLSDWENVTENSGSIVTIDYPTDLADLPVPTPSSRWDVATTINAFGESYPEQQTQLWGRAREFTIGACTYDVIPGKIQYVNNTRTIDEKVYYFPDLGISLLYGFDTSESEAETYTFTNIEAFK